MSEVTPRDLASLLPVKVLLIDPYEKDRLYWRDCLSNASPEYVLYEAASGTAGLHLCQTQDFDCVITELDLGDLSGYHILINLVPSATFPRNAVVILTHLTSDLLPDLSKKNGAQAHLIKRFTSCEQLDMAARKAIAAVGHIKKEVH